jgi:hypothetical protein
MAQGDITLFEEAKAYIVDGGWEAADDIKVALFDNTLAPTAADAAPILGDYTQMETAGTYPSGGDSLGNLGTLVTEVGGAVKLDSATNPVWLKNASNGVDASWAYIYHVTTGLGICFVELGTVDMTAGDLTLNWHANGIVTW